MNKYSEAEKALLTEKHFKKNLLCKDIETAIPNGACGFYLMGIIAEKLVNKKIKKNLEPNNRCI